MWSNIVCETMQQLILIDRQLKGLLCIKVVVVEGTIIVKLILKGQQIQEGIYMELELVDLPSNSI